MLLLIIIDIVYQMFKFLVVFVYVIASTHLIKKSVSIAVVLHVFGAASSSESRARTELLAQLYSVPVVLCVDGWWRKCSFVRWCVTVLVFHLFLFIQCIRVDVDRFNYIVFFCRNFCVPRSWTETKSVQSDYTGRPIKYSLRLLICV